MAMDVAVNAAAGALKAFFADLPEPLIPYSLHPELVEAASKNEHRRLLSTVQTGHAATAGISLQLFCEVIASSSLQGFVHLNTF